MAVNLTVSYIISTLLLGFGIVSGTVNYPAEPAVAFCVLISTVPFWSYDTIYRSIIYRFVVSIIFIAIAVPTKDPSVIWTDIVDVVFYFAIGTLVGAFTQVLTTSAFYLRANMKKEIAEKTFQLQNFSKQTVQAIVHTIDAKDRYTNGHSNRVAIYSKMIAQRMGMSDEEIDNLYYIAMLHDVGKIGVPDNIINKPGKLTDSEFDVIKQHPTIGHQILSEIDSIPGVAIGALSHHERYDGKGYPNGLAGEDIPLIARIIAIADAYDAMTSNRSYRKYLPQEKVREELVNGRGKQFDPVLVEHMIQIIDEDKEYALHE